MSDIDTLPDRVRQLLLGDPRITEKKGFGGIMFLVNGNLLVAPKKDGRMLVHVAKDDHDAALSREGASPMEHGTRTMKGFVWVDGYALEHDDDLRDWLALAERCAAALPPK